MQASRVFNHYFLTYHNFPPLPKRLTVIAANRSTLTISDLSANLKPFYSISPQLSHYFYSNLFTDFFQSNLFTFSENNRNRIYSCYLVISYNQLTLNINALHFFFRTKIHHKVMPRTLCNYIFAAWQVYRIEN